MVQRLHTFVLSGAIAASLAAGSLPKPAVADTTSTLTTIAGAAALIGGLVLYNNYEHKKQAANTVVGYTRNGGTVYGDGRIVMPNGQTIYPNSNGTYPWGQYAYYQPQATGYTYDTDRTGEYDKTHRHGSYASRYHNNGDNDMNGQDRDRDHNWKHKDRDKDNDHHHPDDRPTPQPNF